MCLRSKKKIGKQGKIIGIYSSDRSLELLNKIGLYDQVVKLDATNAMQCYGKIIELTNGNLADIVINCVNVTNTEMSSILMTKERGIVYFFSIAISFTKAALGAEGIGKDIDMIIGNGYAKDHAEIALNILRENKTIREIYEKLYV